MFSKIDVPYTKFTKYCFEKHGNLYIASKFSISEGIIENVSVSIRNCNQVHNCILLINLSL